MNQQTQQPQEPDLQTLKKSVEIVVESLNKGVKSGLYENMDEVVATRSAVTYVANSINYYLNSKKVEQEQSKKKVVKEED